MRARNLAERYLVSVLVIALAIGAQTEIWADRIEGPRVVLVVAGLLYTLPLLASRSHPLAAAITVFAALAIQSFLATEVTNNSPLPFVATLAAFFLVAFYGEHTGALIGLGAGVAAVVIVSVNEATMDAAEILVTSLICGAIWLAGFALRIRLERSAVAEERAERAERDRDTAAQLAVAEERARISRELHDSVAHSVSVMVLQTGAARRRLSADQADERQALVTVENTGRQALGEMRQLLGVMRAQDDPAETAPQPGLGACSEVGCR